MLCMNQLDLLKVKFQSSKRRPKGDIGRGMIHAGEGSGLGGWAQMSRLQYNSTVMRAAGGFTLSYASLSDLFPAC